MKTQKTWIMAIAAVVAIVTAGAPLFAAGGKQDASGPMETKTVPEPVPEPAPQPAPQAALKELEKVHTVTAADFKTVTVAEDGSSVTLSYYTGSAQNIRIPAELEGLPIDWVVLSFGENTTIRSATIAEGFTAFGSLFQGCTSLTSVTLPKGITKIGWRMFSGCKSLTSLTIPDSVTEIGYKAFSYSGIKELVIPGSVTKLGDGLFTDSAIERITLPAGLKEISQDMFYNCKNLRSITLPEGLTAIGRSAFNSSRLQSIVIPDSVTKIESGAFEDCKNLREVTMPKRLTKLSGQVVVKSDITSTYGDTTSTYSTYSGAFEGCSSLKRIVIPAGVTTLEGYAFKDCTALEEITFEGNVIFETNAFGGCTNIKKLNAGPGVTKINGVKSIPGPNVSGLPLKEQAEFKAAWTAFVEKYK